MVSFGGLARLLFGSANGRRVRRFGRRRGRGRGVLRLGLGGKGAEGQRGGEQAGFQAEDHGFRFLPDGAGPGFCRGMWLFQDRSANRSRRKRRASVDIAKGPSYLSHVLKVQPVPVKSSGDPPAAAGGEKPHRQFSWKDPSWSVSVA